MRKKTLTVYITLALAAGAMAAAVTAPAEVIDNLDFFSDFELVSNLEILEEEPGEEGGPVVSTSAASAPASTETVKASTVAVEGL
ncbi:MAG: hypothetical protein A2X28_06150 [Elusimicrobia bacterium GWA2_56_46]|nr:MAG: hypothetical protein A2X28_06150 [Elusimicrobia bacterium GWA2_56_46]OGR54614.1 MAG: hypothetical protein A2X39_02200 [Elusimicrobia bacterium GWC2_56_31]HBB67750.1 hypothetical protein [Elusimicrobiota bacterium]HBW23905.1 hypothetical protein [Elusimicrobiota bacterium]